MLIFAVDQLGIADMDGYGHMWYGNYVKFLDRALHSDVGLVSLELVWLVFKRSVEWGDSGTTIGTWRVHPEYVYQRWVTLDDVVCAEAVQRHAQCDAPFAPPPLWVTRAFQRGVHGSAVPRVFTTTTETRRTVYRDMLDGGALRRQPPP